MSDECKQIYHLYISTNNMSDEAKRTTREQIDCYLAYLESHPEIKLNKNDPSRPRRIEELWEDLAEQLNALRGPTRSAAKWKECLSHWKNQVRSRARKTKAIKMATGGGPCSQDELGAVESRALEAFGTTVVVDCIPDVATLGIESGIVESDLSDLSSHTWPTSTPTTSRKRKSTSTDIVKELVENVKTRNEEEKEYRDEVLKRLENVANSFEQVAGSMNNMANALFSLSQSIANNFQKQNKYNE